MNVLDVAREYFPDEPDKFLEDIIWSETTFPFTRNENWIRQQISEFKVALETCSILPSEIQERDFHIAMGTE